MAQPLILPKGVIKNSEGISDSIALAMALPVDLAEIQRLWRVYTTTKKALRDPTAARLENFWWRIWGSRSRELQSITVSMLFAYISEGNSFVPLTSSANRDEGTPTSLKQIGFGDSSSPQIHRPGSERHSSTPKVSIVPPPSILKGSDSRKKDRNFSSGGPRPTARFISPHESESENTPISPNSHVVVQPPSPVTQEPKAKKQTVSSGKKRAVFVASSGRNKRPVPVKRQSSQSSTDSLAKGGDVIALSSDQTPPLYLAKPQERGKQRVSTVSQENPTSSDQPEPACSLSKAKGVDHREKPSTRPGLGRKESSKEESHVDSEPGPSRRLRPIENMQVPDDLTPEELDELEIQRLLLAEANARVEKITKNKFPAALPSPKKPGLIRKGSNGMLDPAGAGRLAQTRNKSAPSFAPTFVDANGQLDLGEKPVDKKQDKGKGRESNNHTSKDDDMFSKRPVQSITSSSVPDFSNSMSRSKSQLTLLLEKNRVHNIDNPSDR